MEDRTITDAWTEFDSGHGREKPIRTRDELQRVIHSIGLHYRDLDERFWGAVWESNWPFDLTISTTDVVARYNGVTAIF